MTDGDLITQMSITHPAAEVGAEIKSVGRKTNGEDAHSQQRAAPQGQMPEKSGSVLVTACRPIAVSLTEALNEYVSTQNI